MMTLSCIFQLNWVLLSCGVARMLQHSTPREVWCGGVDAAKSIEVIVFIRCKQIKDG